MQLTIVNTCEPIVYEAFSLYSFASYKLTNFPQFLICPAVFTHRHSCFAVVVAKWA